MNKDFVLVISCAFFSEAMKKAVAYVKTISHIYFNWVRLVDYSNLSFNITNSIFNSKFGKRPFRVTFPLHQFCVYVVMGFSYIIS